MEVAPTAAFWAEYQSQRFFFCSDLCCRLFKSDPDRYTGALATVTLGGPRRIAYFSMEIAADDRIPTYGGGLGVLAGDTLKSYADLRIPAVAVSLMYKNGYFKQRVDAQGAQEETGEVWQPSDVASLLDARVHVYIEGRRVALKIWHYDILGSAGYRVPVFALDADVEENTDADRRLTDWLYGGDERYRLAQEVILGMGGVRALRALGYTAIERFHMNEGHAALLSIELLRESYSARGYWNFDGVQIMCVFTTHTPISAGHDRFNYELVQDVVRDTAPLDVIKMLAGAEELNMTRLALNTSRYVNGVARKHAEVSREMFAGYSIDSITNGVHSNTWTSEPFRRLYQLYIPGWANDPFSLRNAVGIPNAEIWEAHAEAKAALIDQVKQRTGTAFGADVFTIGFARRATMYKRPDLVFTDNQQLIDAASAEGPIQILFAGKAHPRDEAGKELIRRIVHISTQLPAHVKVLYLENYDLALGRLLTSGVDLWLNTPQRPLEASGTSGMKAAHNGIPSLSVLDGWWIEGHIEGVTGWSIGPASADHVADDANDQDANDLYQKLRTVILPLYYQDRERWIDVMRQAIAFNASFFNTHRMAQQYAANAYV